MRDTTMDTWILQGAESSACKQSPIRKVPIVAAVAFVPSSPRAFNRFLIKRDAPPPGSRSPETHPDAAASFQCRTNHARFSTHLGTARSLTNAGDAHVLETHTLSKPDEDPWTYEDTNLARAALVRETEEYNSV